MLPDIDIDCADRAQILNLIRYHSARQSGNVNKKHNSGIYVTDIPVDPVSNTAAIDLRQQNSMDTSR